MRFNATDINNKGLFLKKGNIPGLAASISIPGFLLLSFVMENFSRRWSN